MWYLLLLSPQGSTRGEGAASQEKARRKELVSAHRLIWVIGMESFSN